jgi:DNA-binding PadR family transcriptional regulator
MNHRGDFWFGFDPCDWGRGRRRGGHRRRRQWFGSGDNPTLQWLEDEELVRCEERDGKKIYSITDAGREFLDENKSSVEDIFERIDEMIDRFVRNPMPDVNRATGKLVAQVYRSSWQLRDDVEKRQRITEVLENALRELEALAT